MHYVLIAKIFIASFIFSFSLLKSFKCASTIWDRNSNSELNHKISLQNITQLYLFPNESLLVLFVCDSRGILLNIPPGLDSKDPHPIFHITACQRSLFSFAPFHKYKAHPNYYIYGYQNYLC